MQGKLRCGVYTRVSTDNQKEVEFNSCKSQEEKIKSFIKSQENMEIIRIYSDPGFTGANLNRPALQQLLNDIKQNKINLVISYKIDRLTRSPKDFYQLIELFDKYRVDFISVTERFDTSTPSGRLLRNIMLTFAQFERELASERTKDKLLQRAEKGMWNGGIVPFGYKAENKKLKIDKDNANIIRSIYESYINGNSISKISKTTDLSKNRISTILKNPVYIGKIKYAGKIYQGIHKSIISEEIFNLAQSMHKKKKRKIRLYKNYALAGLVRCKECNSSMTPCHTNKKSGRKSKRYYYYRCTSTFKKEWKICQTRQVNANRLENYIFKNLKRISLDKHYIDSLIFKLKYSQAGDRIALNQNKFGSGQGLSPNNSEHIYQGLNREHKNLQEGYRSRLEPSKTCSESAEISGEIFAQTLQHFVKNLPKIKGSDKNIFVKKFIKRIDYSKEEIAVILYYKRGSKEEDTSNNASGFPCQATGRNLVSAHHKKITPTHMNRGNCSNWLLGQDSLHYVQDKLTY